MNLTIRQKEILDFIDQFVQTTGTAPTMNEIRDHFKLKSLATVHKHLKALVSRGKIRRSQNQARAMEIIPVSGVASCDIPLLGRICAGQPIEAYEIPDVLSVPEDMLGRGETFSLQVQGDSMIDAGICPGDYIIVESRNQARDGEIVIAFINGDEATVKRFYKEGHIVRLQPENATMEPLYIPEDNIQIRGIVIGLIRKYHR